VTLTGDLTDILALSLRFNALVFIATIMHELIDYARVNKIIQSRIYTTNSSVLCVTELIKFKVIF